MREDCSTGSTFSDHLPPPARAAATWALSDVFLEELTSRGNVQASPLTPSAFAAPCPGNVRELKRLHRAFTMAEKEVIPDPRRVEAPSARLDHPRPGTSLARRAPLSWPPCINAGPSGRPPDAGLALKTSTPASATTPSGYSTRPVPARAAVEENGERSRRGNCRGERVPIHDLTRSGPLCFFSSTALKKAAFPASLCVSKTSSHVSSRHVPLTGAGTPRRIYLPVVATRGMSCDVSSHAFASF